MPHFELRKLIQEQQILPVTLSAYAEIGLAQGFPDLKMQKIAQPKTMD